MTIDDVLNLTGDRTTDDAGHLASFVFRRPGLIGHLEARLDKSGGPSPALWKVQWTAHWRSEQGQEERDSSTDLRGLLGRFIDLRIDLTPAASLDELTP